MCADLLSHAEDGQGHHQVLAGRFAYLDVLLGPRSIDRFRVVGPRRPFVHYRRPAAEGALHGGRHGGASEHLITLGAGLRPRATGAQ